MSVWPPVHDMGIILTGVEYKWHLPSLEYFTYRRALGPGEIDVKYCCRDVRASGDVNGLTYTRRGEDFGARILKNGYRVRSHESIVFGDENLLTNKKFTHYAHRIRTSTFTNARLRQQFVRPHL